MCYNHCEKLTVAKTSQQTKIDVGDSHSPTAAILATLDFWHAGMTSWLLESRLAGWISIQEHTVKLLSISESCTLYIGIAMVVLYKL